ncbi:MAG: hypothetical protein KY476_27285 [Planctomycetes bacterium]|nr:hypothetical protein [Planctomycetota bacterium]
MNASAHSRQIVACRLMVAAGVAALLLAGGCGGDTDSKVGRNQRDAAGEAQVTIHVAEMSGRLKLY